MRPMAALGASAITRRSQHSASAQPPAGQCPPIAATVASGERRNATRQPVCARQNLLRGGAGAHACV